jgi:S-adenosylmethionine:tRNA ribosyltransferase-isomerase
VRLDLFDYDLPEELIASRPTEARDGARMLHVPSDGALHDGWVRELAARIPEGSTVVVNDTKVLPARLFGAKTSGGRVELLLVERTDGALGPSQAGSTQRWRAMARSSKALREGQQIAIAEGLVATIAVERDPDGTLEVELATTSGADISTLVEAHGHVPLPPYLRRDDDASDRERYQTIFAREPGAVAAPTAGLHLTERILDELRARDVAIAATTLHVSLGTFAPVKVDDLDDHAMHAETFHVSDDLVAAVARARARNAPVVAIGTTVVRALESAADPARPGHVVARSGRTRILIQPGYSFRVVDRLLTNFHLPKSTLIALVAAFVGRERILGAYRHAVASRYRFFSYGDAMLLERSDVASHAP